MKKKSALCNVFFLTLPSVLIFLVILEAAFRIAGYFYLRPYKPGISMSMPARGSGEFNILCLGDSFTFGLGAEPGNNYPVYLEKILNEGRPDKKFRVFNLGVLGNNSSSDILNRLEAQITQYRPDMIIVLAGCNNTWLLSGRDFFFLMGRRNNGLGGKIIRRLDSSFEASRVYKMFKIAVFQLKYGRVCKALNSGSIDVKPSGSSGGGASFRVASDINLKIISLLNSKEYESARQELRKAVRDPLFISSVFNVESVFNFLRTSTEGDLTRLSGEIDIVRNIIKSEYSRDTCRDIDEIFSGLLYLAKNMDISLRLLKYDLARIAGACRKNGITLVLQTYPFTGLGASNAIKEASGELKVPLVDNCRLFEEKLNGRSRSVFFVTDGHCNSQGYRVMAENIRDTLISHNLLAG